MNRYCKNARKATTSDEEVNKKQELMWKAPLRNLTLTTTPPNLPRPPKIDLKIGGAGGGAVHRDSVGRIGVQDLREGAKPLDWHAVAVEKRHGVIDVDVLIDGRAYRDGHHEHVSLAAGDDG